MFKRKKKKTGVQTPEFRKPTLPPEPRKFEDMTPDEQWKSDILRVCGRAYNQSKDIIKVINESGFEKPTVVIKIFSNHTYTVYINEEDDEQYVGGTEE